MHLLQFSTAAKDNATTAAAQQQSLSLSASLSTTGDSTCTAKETPAPLEWPVLVVSRDNVPIDSPRPLHTRSHGKKTSLAGHSPASVDLVRRWFAASERHQVLHMRVV
jgi:hypothetical protein